MIKVLEVVAPDASPELSARVAALRAGLDPGRFAVSRVDRTSGLYRLFVEERPDVVHVHSSKSTALLRLLAKIAGVKKFINAPLREAYLGDFPPLLPHDGIVVGSAGTMERANDPDAWVLLAQRLTDSRNGVACVWIGGGEGEATARTHLANMNLLMKVTVTGPLPADQAREKLRGLDLFVRYARAGAGPGAVLEAMACGLPVVASDTPEHRDLVADGATGFLVADEIKLLERCQQLLDDKALRQRLGAAGRDRVRDRFSPDQMIAELSHLYSNK